MAIDSLLEALEVNAEEHIQEILTRAKKEADEILGNALSKGEVIKKKHMESAARAIEIERTKLLSGIREENKRRTIKIKNEIFQRAFREAEEYLATMREHPHYEIGYREMIKEVLEEIGSEEVQLHIDRRDEVLCRKILTELNINCKIIPDLECAGGLNGSTRDEKFTVYNTIESRMQKAKDPLRSEIIAILYGE
jgi:vacuolar-type H+-ATPase subunit E/Vma4